MNIAFYCSSLSWGGLEMNMLKRAKWMQERGHGVQIFCTKNSPFHNNALREKLVTEGVERNKKSIDFLSSFRLAKIFRKEKIDLIWFADKRDLSLIVGIKMLSTQPIKVLFQQSMQIGVGKREWWHTIRFKRIDYWITPLNYLVTQIRERTKYPANRVHVVPQGLDIQKFLSEIPPRVEARKRFSLDENDLVIGMLGRIDPHKAQRFVWQEVVKLQEQNRGLKLLFIGDKTVGEWESYYEQLVNDIKTGEHSNDVQLYPFMEEVGYFYSAIDIFVMASKNETYGMVTIEAMLSGKKIVGTNAAGTRELLAQESKGYYFDWMDSESFSKALFQIIEQPSEAESRAKAAKSFAEKTFSHNSELDRIEDIIVVNHKRE